MGHVQKGSILWVIQEKMFNSLSHFPDRINPFCESKFLWKKILWVTFKKWVRFFESYAKKGFNSSHTPKWGRFYSFSHAQKIQLFELHSKKVQFFESFFQTGSIISVSQNLCKKSLGHVHKMGSICVGHVAKKGSILWVMSKKKSSILWIVFEKGVQFCELYSKEINSWSHLKKKVGFFESYFWKKVQFFESY